MFLLCRGLSFGEIVYFLSTVLFIPLVAMEDLRHFDMFGENIQKTGPNPTLSAEWGHVLAKHHQATLKRKVSPERWHEICKLGLIDGIVICFFWLKSHHECYFF